MSDTNQPDPGSAWVPPASGGDSGGPTAPIPPTPSGAYPTPPPGPRPGGPQEAMADGTGFLTALFDFSFSHFVTPKLVRFVYLLATVALGIVWVFWVVVGFTRGGGAGVAALVLGAIALVIYLALIRMTLEFYLSVVRMSQDIHSRLPSA